jgi:hypothetical protein
MAAVQQKGKGGSVTTTEDEAAAAPLAYSS